MSHSMDEAKTPYGKGDSTYKAAGEETGIRQLVSDFYDLMASDSRFTTIHGWHSSPDELTRDKLACFLCAWMGGPKLYSEKYGGLSIPAAHAHLPVTSNERDQWLRCMTEALDKQAYPTELKRYLIQQMSIPAERIRQSCEDNET